MMGIGRDELDQLTRAELVQRARALGVDKADVLTRLELIDEVVSLTVPDEGERRAARGLLGRARDLVARVMEKGLHLPDAAQRIRIPPSHAALASSSPQPISTVALAQVYARQGHRAQARRVIDEVLSADPDNEAAITFRKELEGAKRPASKEPDSGPEAEHAATQPVTPRKMPEVPTQDRIEVVRTDDRFRITWRLRPATFARSRARLPEGRLVLRMVHSLATEAGPELHTEDRELDRLAGSTDFLLPEGSVTSHAALGWRDGSEFRVLVTEPS